MALTPESIAETWSNGNTVQIATPADYIVFVTYLNGYKQSDTMRNAEIIADLDFENNDNFVFFSGVDFKNLTLNGNNHSIKNVVLNGSFNLLFLFASGAYGLTSTLILKNILFENFYIQSNNYVYLFRFSTLQNVQVKNCRFVAASDFLGTASCLLNGYASAATLRVGNNYTGCSGMDNNSKRVALLDTVTRTTQGGTAYGFLTQTGSSARFTYSQLFTRNRFYNFDTVYGMSYTSSTPSMSYAAITAENAVSIYPLQGWDPQGYATYYDSTLVPNAGAFTTAGLPTTTLKSVAAMQQNGFNVEAV